MAVSMEHYLCFRSYVLSRKVQCMDNVKNYNDDLSALGMLSDIWKAVTKNTRTQFKVASATRVSRSECLHHMMIATRLNLINSSADLTEHLNAAGAFHMKMTLEQFTKADNKIKLCAELHKKTVCQVLEEDYLHHLCLHSDNEEPVTVLPTSSKATRTLMALSAV